MCPQVAGSCLPSVLRTTQCPTGSGHTRWGGEERNWRRMASVRGPAIRNHTHTQQHPAPPLTNAALTSYIFHTASTLMTQLLLAGASLARPELLYSFVLFFLSHHLHSRLWFLGSAAWLSDGENIALVRQFNQEELYIQRVQKEQVKNCLVQEVHGVVNVSRCALRLFTSTVPPLSTFSLRLLVVGQASPRSRSTERQSEFRPKQDGQTLDCHRCG